MARYTLELQLAWCVAINVLVFGSGYAFARRRMTISRSQAVLDAALIGFSIQYLSVFGPGLVGLLTPVAVTLVAAVLAIVLIVCSVGAGCELRRFTWDRSTIAVLGMASFAGAFVLCFAHSQASLPVFSNDALTYHFPAAVAWLQSGRITLLPTWFFNPANTYSPLAGSAFVAWLLIPFNGDAVARFVEVPALLAVGVGVYRLGRELGASSVATAIVAASAVLCRPIFLQCMMGKDDLFVVLFLLAALVGLSPARSTERFAMCRVGLSIGLLLSMKLTAVLVVPALLLAIGGQRWKPSRWVVVTAIVAAFAGPWFVRNWIDTGNPIFPLRVGRLLPGLFTAARSDELASAGGWRFLVGGTYALPEALALMLGAIWVTALCRRRGGKDPQWRAAVLGPLIGVLLFYFRSPFPEFRFVTPLLAVLFALAAGVLCRWLPRPWAIAAAGALAVASLATVEVPDQFDIVWHLLATSAVIAIAIVALTLSAVRLSSARRMTRVYAPLAAAAVLLVFVQWSAYVRGCRETLYSDGSAYQQKYPDPFPLWKFVDEFIPPNSTLAYTNLHLIYPLQGPTLQRRLVYVPTRDGLNTIATLPYLGDHLSGERLVRAAVAATVEQPDAALWLERVKQSGASYLVVGSAAAAAPPELHMCLDRPAVFHRVMQCDGGSVFAILPAR